LPILACRLAPLSHNFSSPFNFATIAEKGYNLTLSPIIAVLPTVIPCG